jgi:hypothetical protein
MFTIIFYLLSNSKVQMSVSLRLSLFLLLSAFSIQMIQNPKNVKMNAMNAVLITVIYFLLTVTIGSTGKIEGMSPSVPTTTMPTTTAPSSPGTTTMPTTTAPSSPGTTTMPATTSTPLPQVTFSPLGTASTGATPVKPKVTMNFDEKAVLDQEQLANDSENKAIKNEELRPEDQNYVFIHQKYWMDQDPNKAICDTGCEIQPVEIGSVQQYLRIDRYMKNDSRTSEVAKSSKADKLY